MTFRPNVVHFRVAKEPRVALEPQVVDPEVREYGVRRRFHQILRKLCVCV